MDRLFQEYGARKCEDFEVLPKRSPYFGGYQSLQLLNL